MAKALDDCIKLAETLDSMTDEVDGLLFNEGHTRDPNFGLTDSVLMSGMCLSRTQRLSIGPCVAQLAIQHPFERRWHVHVPEPTL